MKSTVNVFVANFSSAVALRDHIQAAVDQAVSDVGAGIANELDLRPVIKVVVELNSNVIDFEAGPGRHRWPALPDAGRSIVRPKSQLPPFVPTTTLTRRRPLISSSMGVTFSVVVTPGDFGDASALRDHIQSAVDGTMVIAGAGSVGNIIVSLDSNEAIVFEPGPDVQTLGDPSSAEVAIARRSYPTTTLTREATFDLELNGVTFSVVIASGDFGDAAALRDHIQSAVDGATVIAGAGSAE